MLVKTAHRRFFCKTLAAVCILLAVNVSAHHGFGVHYDVTQKIEIEGVLQKTDLRNPHSFLHVLVEGQHGSDIWVCETQAKSVMLRKGIAEEQFVIGQSITIQGSVARRARNHCEIGTVTFADGSSLIFRSAQGRANIGEYKSPPAESDSVIGTWIRATFKGVPIDDGSIEGITEAGRLANNTYSALTDDPSIYCQVANPLRAWVAPGTPTQISLENDSVVIQHEFMDARRQIKLHPQADLPFSLPADYVPDEMGYAYGMLNDGELIVYSAGFKAGVLITQLQDSGVLFTDQMHMTETFRLNKDTGTLDYLWRSVDPHYYPDGISGKLELTRVDMQVEQFDCKLTTEN